MPEAIMNLHMHTTYSDGTGSHQDLARAALETGIDVIAVTDHNVFVQGPEGYYREGDRSVLMLIGEEIHDRRRVPQKNHLLVLGVNQDLADLAEDSQALIDAAAEQGGVTFLAHPTDPAAPDFDQGDISWVNWDVDGFTGLELWNGFSEFKRHLTGKLKAIYYAYQPERIARGPFPETISRWDQLTSSGRQVVAVGGSDAHALRVNLGPLRRTLFPYQFHFRAINTHLILPDPLTGEYEEDRSAVLAALRQGHAFIGYDLPASTRGFRFHAAGKYQQAIMGDEISPENSLTLQIKLPQQTVCRLIKDGVEIKRWNNRTVCSHTTTKPGVYRVEADLDFKGQLRTWIISNPIYVRESRD